MRLEWSDVERSFVGGVEPHTVAFVDSDWLVGVADVGVWALALAEEDAARALLAVAESAAAAAAPAQRPAVTGDGFVARRARELLGVEAGSAVPEPDVLIETRGDSASLLESTRRVADLGTVVLAGPPKGSFQFDLYPDVHVRGLHLISAALPEPPAAGDRLREVERPALVRLGEPVPPGAAWYRVVPA